MEILYFMELFDLYDKDLIALLFFGAIFIAMLVCWVVEDGLKWYRLNKDKIEVDVSYVAKVALIPLLSLILWVQGADRDFRAKQISKFLYA